MKKVTRPLKKLKLHKETLLDLSELDRVRGGAEEAGLKCQTSPDSCKLSYACG